MQYVIIMLSVLWISLLPVIAQAMDRKEQSYEIGIEVSNIAYEEESVDVKEKGMMGGVYGLYNYRPEWPVVNVVHLDGHINYGQVDYTGSGTIDNIDNYMLEARLWFGRDVDINDSVRLTPYAGIGYRMLFDNLEGMVSSTNAVGYDRLSQYLYVPVGAEFKWQPAGWEIGFTPEFDVFLRGWQHSYLSSIAGFPDIKNTQDSGYGVRGEVKVVKKMQNLNVLAAPYVRYWHIDQSDTATATGTLFQVSGYEPENKSTEIGMRLGVEF